MSEQTMNDGDIALFHAESEWFRTISDQIGTVVIFLTKAIADIQAMNDGLDLGDSFEPSTDALLAAGIEVCKIVFDKNEVEW